MNTDLVIDTHRVDFDVYAEDEVDAMEAANVLCGWIRNLVGKVIGTICYRSEVLTLPYHNPDPQHPSVARATVKAEILTRTV
jgi:hypothetical protein